MNTRKKLGFLAGCALVLSTSLCACRSSATPPMPPPLKEEEETVETVLIVGADYLEVELGAGSILLTAEPSSAFELVWRSSNEAVATVNASGEVRFWEEGNVIVTVYKKDNEKVFDSVWLTIQVKDVDEEREDIFDA